jgi:membrane-associated phospholipid phosphatase
MSSHAFTAGSMPSAPALVRVRRPGAGGALWIAGLCVLAMALLWIVAELVPPAHVRDAVLLRNFTHLEGPQVNSVGNFLLKLLEPLLLTIWGAALILVAIARDRPRVALAVSVVMGFAPLTADRLKPLLAHSHARAGAIHLGPASWPSGHSTAALALALCAVLVAPPRLRPLIAVLGAAFAVAVGCALLILAWHMPSDVLGGYLMAALWMALAVAGLRFADRRWPPARVDRAQA